MSGIVGGIGSKSFVIGINEPEADSWRLTGNLTGDHEPLGGSGHGSLERDDTYGFSSALGAGMTHSSGVFTFPTTGFWHVNFHMECQYLVSDAGRYAYLKVSTNGGSNFYTASTGRCLLLGATFQGCSTNKIIDVTDTTQVKVQFGVIGNASNKTLGSTTENRTFFTFHKIGRT